MNALGSKRLITAREAEAYVPPLHRFAGNYRAVAKLTNWANRPVENDGNVLIEGEPGTGKTSLLISYRREQFKNQFFYREESDPDRERDGRRGMAVRDIESLREWPDRSGNSRYFKQIDGATDTEGHLRNKIETVRYALADHRVVLLDELGELYFRGLDESLRPMLTESGIGVYATAQNFHSKRRTDSSREEDQRLSALLRRFSRPRADEEPTPADHLKFVAFLVEEWTLKVDHPSTLRLLVEKSNGIVGYSKRTLVKAIDEPDRRLTRKLVEESDVDPLS